MLTGVHFLLTYRCTHECDHCFVHSSPRARGTFTLEQIRRVLTQVKEVGSVEWIYFEGGEPFLHYPILLAGLEAARDEGFRTGVVTNAYWAETEADAEVWLRPLARLGLADLALSDDAFHHRGEDSPAERARAAAERLEIPTGTIRIPQPEEGEGVRYRGRAADRLADARPKRPAAEFTECPDEDLRAPGRVHADAMGNVHLCQGILLGNLWEVPLARLLREYDPDRHPVCGPILRGGPARLAEELAIDIEDEYVSACHLCYRVREAALARYPGHLGPGQVYGREE
ncbi:MAG: radical SAM protein [Planctomycetota bacterium]